PKEFHYQNKKLLIGHGDGLGPGDHGYKFIKKIFRNPVCTWLFGILPPYLGMGIADFFSRKSRAKTGQSDEVFMGEDKEWLVVYANIILNKKHYEYFLYVKRYLTLEIKLNAKSLYVYTGDWNKYNSYVVLEKGELNLFYYQSDV